MFWSEVTLKCIEDAIEILVLTNLNFNESGLMNIGRIPMDVDLQEGLIADIDCRLGFLSSRIVEKRVIHSKVSLPHPKLASPIMDCERPHHIDSVLTEEAIHCILCPPPSKASHLDSPPLDKCVGSSSISTEDGFSSSC